MRSMPSSMIVLVMIGGLSLVQPSHSSTELKQSSLSADFTHLESLREDISNPVSWNEACYDEWSRITVLFLPGSQ